MMIMFADAQRMRSVFQWNEAIDRDHLIEQVARRGWSVGSDLFDFWSATGGGVIFESEILFRPPTGLDQSEVEEATALCREGGLPDGLIVFHRGFRVTAVENGTGLYAVFDLAFRRLRHFTSLNDWYVEVIRAEYGERYGLPSL